MLPALFRRVRAVATQALVMVACRSMRVAGRVQLVAVTILGGPTAIHGLREVEISSVIGREVQIVTTGWVYVSGLLNVIDDRMAAR